MMQSGYDFHQLIQDAQTRWLKPAEVLFILENHDEHQVTHELPQRPPSGSLFLFNRRVLKHFRRDGHNWKKKKDGRPGGEGHEKLKVGNAEALNCYYAHGEDNPKFQRRSMWMLDLAHEHIVLVHYRDITEVEQGRLNTESISDLSSEPSSTFSLSPGSCYSVPNSVSVSFSDLHDTHQSQSGPSSLEVSSQVSTGSRSMNQLDWLDGTGKLGMDNIEVTQALRRLEEHLSLDDDSFKDFLASDSQVENIDCCTVGEHNSDTQGSGSLQHDQFYGRHAGLVAASSNSVIEQQSVGKAVVDHSNGGYYTAKPDESLPWSNVFDLPDVYSQIGSQKNQACALDESEKHFSSSKAAEQYNNYQWNFGGNNMAAAPPFVPQEVKKIHFPAYSSLVANHNSNQESCATIVQKFKIREMSPQYGFANETTKVIIVGSFLSDPSQSRWSCMFGDIEVPLQIVQEGVVCCQAPPHHPGKVNLCITTSNHKPCSEVREFEYRDNHSCICYDRRPRGEDSRTTEELMLLVRFVHMLLSESSIQDSDSNELGIDLLRKSKTNEDSWNEIMQALLIGSEPSSATTDWLLQQLLKDKLQQWLSSRAQDGADNLVFCLSRKEKGIIHMIAGLGYEWALNPVLNAGVGINFRDTNGWTALHWAAQFGREKMVAALIAAGASAGAITDPSAQNPRGKFPASVAAASGHKGLAGYLSEVALIRHLSSLTIGTDEMSKGSAELQAEITVNNVANNSVASSVDQVSLKQTLKAVRNVAQAAAQIQAAFRAHSFRRRQQKDAAAAAGVDEYGFSTNDIQNLSAASKMVFRSLCDRNSAALSVQKNYLGWKGRKDFLALRRKVVKIQAHVRGYQVRKKYKQICWAVGFWSNVVLRWRRKGVGLRGIKPESGLDKEINGDEDIDDIVKTFRNERVNVSIDEAVSRVLSMVESPEARQQYIRMLEKHQQAEAELADLASEVASTSQADIFDMDGDDIFKLLS